MNKYNNILNLYYNNLLTNYSDNYINNYQLVINYLIKLQKNNKINKTNNYNFNLLEDLDIFNVDGICDKLISTQSIIGKILFQKQLINLQNNKLTLTNKQTIIKKWIHKKITLLDYVKLFNQLSKKEDDILWFLKEPTEELNELLNNLYFKSSYLKWMNSNYYLQKFMLIYKIYLAPVNIIVIPIISLIILPYVIIRFMYKIPIGLKFYYNILKILLSKFSILNNFSNNKFHSLLALFSFSTYLYEGYRNIMYSIKLKKIINMLGKRIQSLQLLTNILNKVNTPEIRELLTDKQLTKLDDILKYKIINIIKSSKKDTDIVINYSKIRELKDELFQIYKFIGSIEVIVSNCITFMRYNKNKNKLNFAEYTNDNLVIENFWHPIIDDTKIVTNSVKMDKQLINIVTGPNSGGKSIIIKSILINVLLAQTLTFSPCKLIKINPFQIVESYISTPDIVGFKSLFEAEIYRVKDFINKLELLNKNKKENTRSLIIMDELFNSTNYDEGLLASLTILKLLKKYPNNLAFITTHYHKLADILDKDDLVTNYCVNYNEITKTFNYKLNKGINKQKLALQLIKDLFN